MILRRENQESLFELIWAASFCLRSAGRLDGNSKLPHAKYSSIHPRLARRCHPRARHNSLDASYPGTIARYCRSYRRNPTSLRDNALRAAFHESFADRSCSNMLSRARHHSWPFRSRSHCPRDNLSSIQNALHIPIPLRSADGNSGWFSSIAMTHSRLHRPTTHLLQDAFLAPHPSSEGIGLPEQPPSVAHAAHSLKVTANLPTANCVGKVTVCCGCSRAYSLEPIRKWPAPTTIIAGQTIFAIEERAAGRQNCRRGLGIVLLTGCQNFSCTADRLPGADDILGLKRIRTARPEPTDRSQNR